MPVVSGSLVFVTSRPSAVSEVWVRARDVRTSVQGVVVESNDRIPVANGVVSFEVLPGPAVMTLVEAGRPVDTIPIVVGDAPEQSLMDVVDAALIVDESQASVIESLAAQVVADVKVARAAASEAADSKAAADVSAKAAKASQDAAAGSASSAKQSEFNSAAFKNAADSSASDAATSAGNAKKSESAAATSAGNAKTSEDAAKAAQARSEEIATSTSWDGDKLTVNGKTSPSLRGPKGEKGETGSVENVSWDDITGKPAAYPPAPHTHTTAQVEGLDDALAGKADKGHMHKIEDVDGLKERLDSYSLDIGSVTTSMGEIFSKLDEKASISYLNSQIASTRSYVDREVANGSQIQVVSSLPSYPDSSTVYIVV